VKRDLFSISLKDTILRIISVALLLTPLYNYGEVYVLFTGNVVDQASLKTPLEIKIIKDFLIILVLFLSVALLLKRQKIHKQMFIAFAFICVSLYSVLISIDTSFLSFVIGIRWLIPFILAFLLLGVVNKNYLYHLANVLALLFVVHFIFQVLQLFYSGHWYGVSSFGLSLRNPGILFIPSTSAFFSIMVLFFTLNYMKHDNNRMFLLLLIPFSILLTASGTGVIALITVYIVNISQKMKVGKLVILFLPLLAVSSIPILEFFTGRTGIVEQSFGARYEIFKDLLISSNLFSENFGYGTSTAYLLSNYLGIDNVGVPTESLFSALLVNLGFVPFLLFLTFLFIFALKAYLLRREDILQFVIIYILFGLTTSVLESFPANLLMSVLLSVYLPVIFNFNFEKPPYNVDRIHNK